jgi:hypothetical protein
LINSTHSIELCQSNMFHQNMLDCLINVLIHINNLSLGSLKNLDGACLSLQNNVSFR